MKKEDCFHYGKIIKTHGFKGELIASVGFDIPGISEKTEYVFIEIEGLLVPFFFESVICTGKNALNIKFEDVNSEDASRRLCGCSLWLSKILLTEKLKKKFELSDFSGYKIIDTAKGEIGKLVSIIEMPQQQLFLINFRSKEILIPVAEEIIIRVDKKTKTIFVDTPIGLIDMYLDS